MNISKLSDHELMIEFGDITLFFDCYSLDDYEMKAAIFPFWGKNRFCCNVVTAFRHVSDEFNRYLQALQQSHGEHNVQVNTMTQNEFECEMQDIDIAMLSGLINANNY